MSQTSIIGRVVRRLEDPRLVTGKGRFVDDLTFGNVHHLAIFRSPVAHARIKRLDVSRALKAPGVVTVLTGQDVLRMSDPFPVGITNPPKYYCMAVDKVRYVGEPVAAVVARDRYAAADALELIEFEYEPLGVVLDPEDALRKDLPPLHEELGGNVAWHRTLKYGDYGEALRASDRVVSIRIRFPRYSSTPLEPYAAIADYDATQGTLTIVSNFQGPWTMITVLCKSLRISEDRLRMIVPKDIGGGFGIKTSLYPYLVLVALASIKAGGPVKWIETRREHMMASSAHPDRVAYFEAAVKNDGTILGVKYKIIDNMGAYVRPPEPANILRPLGNYVGPYRFKNVEVDAYAVVTNKCPTGPNRGLGCQHLYFGLERLIDTIANELGIDPAEVRFRNFIQPNELPYTTPTGGIYDSGNYPAALKLALNLINYGEFRAMQKRAWSEGRYLGLGMATIIDPAGSNMGYITVAYPPEIRAKQLPKSGTVNIARIKVLPSGKVVVKVDSNPQGQGHETVTAQIVAEELKIDVNEVIVEPLQDSLTDEWTVSSGSYSSRFAAFHGSAIALAARNLKERILEIAANLLEARKEDLEISDGTIFVKDDPAHSITLKRLAGTVYWNPTALPQSVEPLLEVSAAYNFPLVGPPKPDDTVNSSGVYGVAADAAIVEVDPETGVIKVLRYVSVHDAGRILNPAIVEGQVHGSIIHGIAGAMYEELVYEGSSGQLLTSTFSEYLCPTALEIPEKIEVAHMESPSPFTILGAKGVGESSSESAPVVIANAVEDALRPLGVKIYELPLTPSKVWELIRRKKGG